MLASSISWHGIERRRFPRFTFGRSPIVRFRGEMPGVSGWAMLADISAGGVGLLLDQELLPGSRLELLLPCGEKGPASTHWAWVRHVHRLTEDTWSVGCQLAPGFAPADLAEFAHDELLALAED
jgi:hypothetical protein